MLWVQLREPIIVTSVVIVVQALIVRTLHISSVSWRKSHCSPRCNVATQTAANEPELDVLIRVLCAVMFKEVA
jgi:hypothetical protein